MDGNEEKVEKKTLKKTICNVVDSLPDGYCFHAWQLKDMVAREYPKSAHCYIDTVMRIVRRDRRFQVKCINGPESLYKKIGTN